MLYGTGPLGRAHTHSAGIKQVGIWKKNKEGEKCEKTITHIHTHINMYMYIQGIVYVGIRIYVAAVSRLSVVIATQHIHGGPSVCHSTFFFPKFRKYAQLYSL